MNDIGLKLLPEEDALMLFRNFVTAKSAAVKMGNQAVAEEYTGKLRQLQELRDWNDEFVALVTDNHVANLQKIEDFLTMQLTAA